MRPERALAATFTRPIAVTGAVVLARPGVARTAAELDRRTVRLAVNRGGHLERVARALFPHASLLPAENFTLPALVQDGAADALLTDDVEADVFAPALGAVDRLGPFTRDHKAFLARESTLAAALDEWLRAREADGSLSELRARWLGADRALRRSAFDADVDAVLALVDLRLAFMPAVALAKAAAGRPIEDRVQEARVLTAACEHAVAAGLAPAPVVAFFSGQLDAARELQYRVLALPKDRRPTPEPLDLEREARPALATISSTIVARLAQLATAPAELAGLDVNGVAEAIDPSLAPEAMRFMIVRLLQTVRAGASGTDVCKRIGSRLESGPQRDGGADSDQKSRANSGTSAVSLR